MLYDQFYSSFKKFVNFRKIYEPGKFFIHANGIDTRRFNIT